MTAKIIEQDESTNQSLEKLFNMEFDEEGKVTKISAATIPVKEKYANRKERRIQKSIARKLVKRSK